LLRFVLRFMQFIVVFLDVSFVISAHLLIVLFLKKLL
jgi:hypothetical protein